jgi:hypothetical protein
MQRAGSGPCCGSVKRTAPLSVKASPIERFPTCLIGGGDRGLQP